ncbi:MAG: bifunctional folylpolyglutamate synthase/dihydrofolate synthase [Desulfuromonadales bacterium]|nr:bifunctional folylpolyglutamate synthase/dihydrofolate synthase [Desulfuromonadales bacterium]
MTGRESLDYLYGLQTFGIKLGLDNIRTLHVRLDSPSSLYKTVLVAGTNGKGSTASALAEMLRQGGVKTGLYTSPHLHCFTERIRIDGTPVDFEILEPLIEDIRLIGRDLPLTFFEFTTALALETFRRNRVEVAVLEVGMGGRLDATNVVSPVLSIITPIAFDHQAHLGSTLEAIAAEKAGIMREGVPVVISRQLPTVLAVLLSAAANAGADPVVDGVDFTSSFDGETMHYQGLDTDLDSLQTALAGVHQQQNMAVALAAAEILRRQGVALDNVNLADGVAKVFWPGRLEWVGSDQRILLDGAHNGAGAEVLAAYLAAGGYHRIHWLVGMKRDKAMLDILQPLLGFVVTLYCVEPPIEEPLLAADLVRAGGEAGLPTVACQDVEHGLRAARLACSDHEIVLVAGSLFLVAAAREILEREKTTVVT